MNNLEKNENCSSKYLTIFAKIVIIIDLNSFNLKTINKLFVYKSI